MRKKITRTNKKDIEKIHPSMIDNGKINSLIIAITLISPAFITLMNNYFYVSISISSICISVIILALIIISAMASRKIKLNVWSVLFCIAMCIFFLVTYIIRENLNYSIAQLFFYVIIPIVVCQQDFSIKKVLEYTIILSIILITGLGRMLRVENVGLNQSDMYNAYCFIPSIIATVIYIANYKTDNALVLAAEICNAIYLVRVAITAPRGFWLAIATLIILLTIKAIRRKKTIYKFLSLIIVTVFSAIFLFNIESITNSIGDLLQNILGERIGIFIKTEALLQKGDLLNGRGEIWLNSINNIALNPIIGYGLESTVYISEGSIPYPHNYVLQLLQDCGFIGLYPITISISALIAYIKKNNDDRSITTTLLFLISISLPIVLISYDIWKYSPFWLLIGYGISIHNKERKYVSS